MIAALIVPVLMLAPFQAAPQPAPPQPPPQQQPAPQQQQQPAPTPPAAAPPLTPQNAVPTTSTSTTAPAQGASSDVANQALQLSLDDCLQLAMANNLQIAGARLDAQGAIQDFGSAWGQFDTIFNAGANWSDGTTAASPSNIVGGVDVGGNPASQHETFQASAGFTGEFLTGTTWTFTVGPRRSQTTVPSSGTDPGFQSDVYTGAWSLDVTQPLLRGGGDFARNSLKLAQQDAEIAALSAETTASDTLQQVMIAYWNLVFARHARGTAEESVQLADELVNITRRKFEQGLQNKIEVTQTEAELATRKEELLSARNVERQAEDDLRRLVLAPMDAKVWQRPIVPVTEPAKAEPMDVDEQAAIEIALRERTDVQSSHRSVERADVSVEQASREADPQLDLSGGYGINANQTSYKDVFTNLDDTNNDELHAALAFSLPIGNRSAGYALRRAEIDREHAGVTLRDTEVNAIALVRAAAREVELQLQKVNSTEETTRLQREVYEGEKRRLENDLSTPFQVREFQRDLLTAIDNETRSRLDLELARVALLSAEGRLLSAYGFERSAPELSLEEAPPAP
jgi:outer membrane protein TolC